VQFTEEQSEVLNLAVFFMFGICAADALSAATWSMRAYDVLSLTVVRMVPVAVALLGLGLRAPTVAFVGWFGPRGLASIILAPVVIEEEPEPAGIEAIFVVVTVTVLLSVFTHGISAVPLSRRYGRR
jgi:sodium/hydrogen antiporter